MHVLDNKGEVWKTFIVMIPTLAAALIAVSRIMDARHHPFDVISGSMLGMLVAWGAYRQYFPPVTETWRKGRAYPIRTWGTEPKRPPSADHALLRDEGFEAPPNPVRSRSQTWNAPSQTAAGAIGGGNVFREQISRSQRQRRHDLGEHTEQSSSSSLDLEGRHPRKPLPGTRPQTRRVPSDIYASSSSDHEDGFEMQPQPGLTTPANRMDHTAVDAFGQDVVYHPPLPNPGNPTTPAGAAPSAPTRGPLSPHMVRAPRSEAGGSSTEEQRPRGVDLVETYR
ncbi:MAG: hypothetical protein Q9213_008392 [Squamulea squamosa]